MTASRYPLPPNDHHRWRGEPRCGRRRFLRANRSICKIATLFFRCDVGLSLRRLLVGFRNGHFTCLHALCYDSSRCPIFIEKVGVGRKRPDRQCSRGVALVLLDHVFGAFGKLRFAVFEAPLHRGCCGSHLLLALLPRGKSAAAQGDAAKVFFIE